MKYSAQEAIEKLNSVGTYQEAINLIYMWVKQDKINPVTMAMLNIAVYNKFE